jgi:hypothetical protein
MRDELLARLSQLVCVLAAGKRVGAHDQIAVHPLSLPVLLYDGEEILKMPG